MKQLPTGEPVWDLDFDESGRLTAPTETALLDQVAAAGVDDLFVFSHGWNTAENSARGLYDEMFPMIRAAADGASGIGKVGFAGIYWPSLWFPPTPATPANHGGSTQAGNGAVTDLDAGTAAVSGAEIAAALLPGFPAEQQRVVAEIGRCIDDGVAAIGAAETDEVKKQRIRHIHQLLQSLLPPRNGMDTGEDGGEIPLVRTSDPVMAYQGLAQTFGTAPPGSAGQSAGDWFGRAINGAKDAARVFSYNIMKARAGDIGRTGLGPLLIKLRQHSSATRVHLIGHSFGARLVAFALAGIGSPQQSPVASLLLVQGAFSHWSFAHQQDNPFDRPGALNAVSDRVHGPLVATYSVYDWAVGVWYPKASFLSRQDTQSNVANRWGGMGADGYQAVNPLEARTMPPAGGAYGFKPRTFYRVNAANVINDVDGQPFSGAHSDIRKPAVAQLVVDAAGAHA